MASKRLADDEIHDALIDDELFANLPLRLAEAYGGRSTLIHWHHADGGASVFAHSGYFSDAQLDTYARQYAKIDPWAEAAGGQRLNGAMDLETLVPVERFVRTEFFNDYIRAMGDDTARCMGVIVQSSLGQGMIAIQRGRSQCGFTDRQVAGLDAAAVHLRRMLAVRGKLAGVGRRLGAVTQMLDALPQAALLLRSDGRIVEANARAAALLAGETLLHIRWGRIGARRGEAALLSGIARACDRYAPCAAVVQLGDAGAVGTISPVKDDSGARRAMLLVSGAPTGDRLPGLQQLYGLTAAEAAVAAELAAGYSIASIAEKRCVSPATVRTQVRSISDKMGCRRQAEIALAAARVLSLP